MVSRRTEENPLKPQRACDVCRRRRVRCDGPVIKDDRCTVCKLGGLDCTYLKRTPMRWPTISYVQCVENRIEAIDNLLQKLFPNVDFTDELGPPITLDNWMHPPSHYEIQRNPLLPNGPKKRQVRRLHSSLSSDESGEEADPGSELGTDISLATAMRASNAAFDRATRAASYQDVGQISETLWLSYPAHEPVEASAFQQSVFLFETFSAPKRSHSIHYELPPQDLIQVLVNSWFDSVSVFLPILHRGLLEQQLNAGRHMTDQRFAALILLVCACSARYSHDSRVLAVPGEWHSAGWQYYSQVEPLVRSMEPLVPDLIDLQLLVLSALFIVNSVSRTGLAPLLVVKGISLAQKVGAHRNRSYRSSPNLVDELWKRAFWAMVCLDRIWSARFGRHCAIRDEDFDLDLPMPIDDEYWDLTDRVNYFPLEKPQPDDQPSSIAYFISKLKITQILAFATRSLYSISSFKLVKDPSLICQMDSALNEWLGELPPHLSWDPRRKNLHWLRQSAVLHLIYHDVQLLLHRPFMFSKTLGLPSLAICTNAARSSISIMENQTELNGLCDHLQAPLIFDSAIVLLLDMWQKMNATRQPPTHSQFADHRRHITVALAELSTLEAAYLPAGKFADVLRDLAGAPSPRGSSGGHFSALTTPKLYAAGDGSSSSSPSDISEDMHIHSFDMLDFPIFSPQRNFASASPVLCAKPDAFDGMPMDMFLNPEQAGLFADLWRNTQSHGAIFPFNEISGQTLTAPGSQEPQLLDGSEMWVESQF